MASDIRKLLDAVARNPNAAKTLGATCRIKISGEGGGEWFFDNKGASSGSKSMRGDADCTIEMDAASFHMLMENPQANGRKLLGAGKLKVQGDPRLVDKLDELLKSDGREQ